jgi:hypothetical protein
VNIQTFGMLSSVVGQTVADVSKNHENFLTSRWKHYGLSKHQHLFTKQNNVTTQTTWNFGNTSWVTSNLTTVVLHEVSKCTEMRPVFLQVSHNVLLPTQQEPCTPNPILTLAFTSH